MSPTRMPALFLGYGSPMNVLKDNACTRTWRQLGETLPRPRAAMVVSAHQFTRGTGVTAMEAPKTIHDFGGFPQTPYSTHYPAPGLSKLAQHPVDLLVPVPVILNKEAWGLDCGPWGVLIKTYPDMDVPMMQLSINNTKPASWHSEMGRKLTALRDEGIMLVASSSVIYNLRIVHWYSGNTPYPWATSSDDYAKANLTWWGPTEQYPSVNYLDHKGGLLSNPTPDRYLPLLYVLGAWDGKGPVMIPVDDIEMGSLSILSVQVGRRILDGTAPIGH